MKLIKDHKSLLLDIGLFLLLYIVSFVIAFMLTSIWGDQVLCYGFSYNISKGLIIYKDFNAVPTPLYFMIASIFIKIFGNYLISICILDSIFAAATGFILYKMIGWKGIFPFIFLIVFIPSPYNLMCLFLLFLILYSIHKNKYNDLLAALIVGIIFITKQNVGVLLFIPMFLYSKKKIKSTLVFMIPFFLICINFLCKNAFFYFFDYAFFSLFEFSGNNYYILSLIFVEVLCASYLMYSLYKSKFQDKEALYILLFQLIIYPICDLRHFIPALVAFIYYFIKTCKSMRGVVVFCVLETIYTIFAFYVNFTPIDIQTNKDFLYLRGPAKISTYLHEIYDRYGDNKENLFFDSEYSYLFKMYFDIPISRLDLLFDGNLGYYSKEGNFKKLEKHCKKEKCTFIILKDIGKDYQGVQYRKFIKDHYKKIEEFHEREVYSSK